MGKVNHSVHCEKRPFETILRHKKVIIESLFESEQKPNAIQRGKERD